MPFLGSNGKAIANGVEQSHLFLKHLQVPVLEQDSSWFVSLETYREPSAAGSAEPLLPPKTPTVK